MTCCLLYYLSFWASFHGLSFCYVLPQPVNWLRCVGAVPSWGWFHPVLTICMPIACTGKFPRTDGYRPGRMAVTGTAASPPKQDKSSPLYFPFVAGWCMPAINKPCCRAYSMKYLRERTAASLSISKEAQKSGRSNCNAAPCTKSPTIRKPPAW